MKIIAVTCRGPNKTENEDRIVIGMNLLAEGSIQTNLSTGVVAIADGVGGNNAGAVASHFVTQKLMSAKEVSQETLIQINLELLDLSSSYNEYRDMATTLSGVSFSKDRNVLFSIGNTRAYQLIGGKYLKQLTSDDTTLNYLLSTGQLLPTDVDNFDRKSEITACLGGGSNDLLKPKFSNLESLDSPLVLSSDGIHDYVSIDLMEEIIEDHGISFDACEFLIKAARAAGSRDDVSILFAIPNISS